VVVKPLSVVAGGVAAVGLGAGDRTIEIGGPAMLRAAARTMSMWPFSPRPSSTDAFLAGLAEGAA